ncbi:formamidopyrimidine-DNA glycosylase [Salegentibacter holothuriorum]|uniref:Formamidopyrimidine-DNA glycosylase n=1 Tax=Salegentibacter holothuriorum TaxID=241145 RepID=A0A1T5C0K2_9FLAO|nr:DNA-formamidopyrimidine glycosylase family protein [Salegentibacter holothuriorum]SKB52819.1 formamidopyrimidine-DNA glycosylase [Salegentibacter holothuriorum]
MPELPEVAYQKKYADATILHKKIVKVETGDKKIYQSDKKDFEKVLQNNQFTGSERLGKYLFLNLEKNRCLVVHFGMTGKLEYYQHDEVPKYAQLTLTFEDYSRVSFTCPRKFGKLYLADSLTEFQKENNLGIDALALGKPEFFEILDGKTGTIKGLLMNQKLIAGIGNLYADEVLFQAKIHPTTKIDKLSEKEKQEIFKEIEKVLEVVKEARVEGKKLPDTYLTSVRKKGEDCPRNNGKIEQIKVSGRTTYFCPTCQKEKS